jgi:hypothetical protein
MKYVIIEPMLFIGRNILRVHMEKDILKIGSRIIWIRKTYLRKI